MSLSWLCSWVKLCPICFESRKKVSCMYLACKAFPQKSGSFSWERIYLVLLMKYETSETRVFFETLLAHLFNYWQWPLLVSPDLRSVGQECGPFSTALSLQRQWSDILIWKLWCEIGQWTNTLLCLLFSTLGSCIFELARIQFSWQLFGKIILFVAHSTGYEQMKTFLVNFLSRVSVNLKSVLSWFISSFEIISE